MTSRYSTSPSHGARSTLTRPWLHTITLYVAPLFVFLGGLFLSTRPASADAGLQFLESFGGLVLCVGAVLVYAVILLRHFAGEPVSSSARAARQPLAVHTIHEFTALYALFIASWLVHALYGVASHLFFPVLMVLFGMLAVTLVAHVHAHRRFA